MGADAPAGGPDDAAWSQEIAGLLAAVPCPQCRTVGSLALTYTLYAKPFGTWSLAGVNPKASCVEIPTLVCTAGGCDYRELPSGWKNGGP